MLCERSAGAVRQDSAAHLLCGLCPSNLGCVCLAGAGKCNATTKGCQAVGAGGAQLLCWLAGCILQYCCSCSEVKE